MEMIAIQSYNSKTHPGGGTATPPHQFPPVAMMKNWLTTGSHDGELINRLTDFVFNH